MRDSNIKTFDGEKLKVKRESAGLSRFELAEKVGIAETQIWRWETGQARPRKSHVVKLAKIFGVTHDELIGVEATA